MLLLKAVHLGALICWTGVLLYLPALLHGLAGRDGALLHLRFARLVFVAGATPAALLAITSGTALFVADKIVAPWLVLKLCLVAGVVLCHLVSGMMILRAEQVSPPTGRYASTLGVLTGLLVGATFWLALAKPV